jgi:hypothetical protein
MRNPDSYRAARRERARIGGKLPDWRTLSRRQVTAVTAANRQLDHDLARAVTEALRVADQLV